MNRIAQQSVTVRGPELSTAAITQETAEQIADQMPDTKPGPYYVSVMKDGGDTRLLSGPYPTHAEALMKVDAAKNIAQSIDPKSIWYYFGTVRMAEDFKGDAILQKLGYSLDCKKVTQ